jgi:hypothetical protein
VRQQKLRETRLKAIAAGVQENIAGTLTKHFKALSSASPGPLGFPSDETLDAKTTHFLWAISVRL